MSVEEKVDGSQFSFAIIDGDLRMQSRNREVHKDEAGGLFGPTAQHIVTIAGNLKPGLHYRGEAISKPRHNVLRYARVPKGHFVLWDVMRPDGSYMDYDQKSAEAKRLGLEVVPEVYRGRLTRDMLESIIDRDSFLGGCKAEGVVIKNYGGGAYQAGKVVCEEFQEVHNAGKIAKKAGETPIEKLIRKYCCNMRLTKAVQRMEEDGRLTHTPKDIGPLMGEVGRDLLAEEEQAIKDDLFKIFWKHIAKEVTRQVPVWYKNQLTVRLFDEG